MHVCNKLPSIWHLAHGQSDAWHTSHESFSHTCEMRPTPFTRKIKSFRISQIGQTLIKPLILFVVIYLFDVWTSDILKIGGSICCNSFFNSIGQLLGYPWKVRGITVQTSYVEGRWHQNWVYMSPKLYFCRRTRKSVKNIFFLFGL